MEVRACVRACTCMHVCVRACMGGRQSSAVHSRRSLCSHPCRSCSSFVVLDTQRTGNFPKLEMANRFPLAWLALADACCCCSLVVCVVRLLLACCWCCCCCVLLLFACCWFVWFVCTGAQGQAGKGSSGNETQLGSTAQHSGRKQTTKNAPMQSTQGARDASS